MKNWIFSVVVLASVVATPLAAAEKDQSESEDRVGLELRITPKRYTVLDYLSDIQESTRITDIDPGNPVRQLETRKNPKYEPLNPLVLFRW
jgi:hypothetical protein